MHARAIFLTCRAASGCEALASTGEASASSKLAARRPVEPHRWNSNSRATMRRCRAVLAALLACAWTAALAPRQPFRRRRTLLQATTDPMPTTNPTLTRWLLDHTRKNTQQEDLEALLSSIAMGCKTISGFVQRARRACSSCWRNCCSYWW